MYITYYFRPKGTKANPWIIAAVPSDVPDRTIIHRGVSSCRKIATRPLTEYEEAEYNKGWRSNMWFYSSFTGLIEDEESLLKLTNDQAVAKAIEDIKKAKAKFKKRI